MISQFYFYFSHIRIFTLNLFNLHLTRTTSSMAIRVPLQETKVEYIYIEHKTYIIIDNQIHLFKRIHEMRQWHFFRKLIDSLSNISSETSGFV